MSMSMLVCVLPSLLIIIGAFIVSMWDILSRSESKARAAILQDIFDRHGASYLLGFPGLIRRWGHIEEMGYVAISERTASLNRWRVRIGLGFVVAGILVILAISVINHSTLLDPESFGIIFPSSGCQMINQLPSPGFAKDPDPYWFAIPAEFFIPEEYSAFEAISIESVEPFVLKVTDETTHHQTELPSEYESLVYKIPKTGKYMFAITSESGYGTDQEYWIHCTY